MWLSGSSGAIVTTLSFCYERFIVTTNKERPTSQERKLILTKYLAETTKEYFLPNEVAKMFRVHVSTVRRWTTEGILDCDITIGGHRRIPKSEILRVGRAYNLIT